MWHRCCSFSSSPSHPSLLPRMPSFVSFPPFSASPTCVVDVRSFLFWRFLSDLAKRQRRSRQTQQKPPLPPSKKRHTHTHTRRGQRAQKCNAMAGNTTPLAPQQIARQLPHNSPLLCQISQSSGEIFCASSYTCRKLQRTRMSLRQRCSAPVHKPLQRKGAIRYIENLQL